MWWNQLHRLDMIPQHKQRSVEWFSQRSTMITASEAHGLFAKQGSWNTLLRKKYEAFMLASESVVAHKEQPTGHAYAWGRSFEPVATAIYEARNHARVGEYGLIPHENPQYRVGASPDGIVVESVNPVYIGRMIEIKCPFSRVITGKPLKKYWIQMQLQMECCDLDETDFLECGFKQFTNAEDLADWLREQSSRQDTQAMEYGAVLETNTASYVSPLQYNRSDISGAILCLDTWIEEKATSITESEESLVFYWALDTVSCVRVLRDRAWFTDTFLPKLTEFWKDFESIREGNMEVPVAVPRKKARLDTAPI